MKYYVNNGNWIAPNIEVTREKALSEYLSHWKNKGIEKVELLKEFKRKEEKYNVVLVSHGMI